MLKSQIWTRSHVFRFFRWPRFFGLWFDHLKILFQEREVNDFLRVELDSLKTKRFGNIVCFLVQESQFTSMKRKFAYGDTSGDLSLQSYCIEMSLLLFFSVGWSKATSSKWYITTTLWYWWRSEAFVYTIEPTMFNFSDLFNVYHNLFILHPRFYVFVVDCKQMLKFSSCSDSRFSWF